MEALASSVYAVVLAGGSGTRFWPKSRHKLPKQLCRIGDSDLSMIELTLKRLEGLVPKERRIIVTHKDQLAKTRELTAGLCDHYLAEPSARNTANALALASLEIQALAEQQGVKNPIMVSLHADALIKKLDVFSASIGQMVQSAERGQLTLLGITPEYPETGYGYIEKGSTLPDLKGTYKVASFREKPKADLAAQYIATQRFLWNSGIFAWKIQTICEELKTYLPASLEALRELQGGAKSFTKIPEAQMAKVYDSLPSVAIDTAVLEKSSNVAVVEADIGWKDVGSWDAIDQCFPTDAAGNVFYGNVINLGSSGVTVDSDAKVVACIGLKDIVVVCSEGAILVCPKDKAQDVKFIVEELKKQGRTDLV